MRMQMFICRYIKMIVVNAACSLVHLANPIAGKEVRRFLLR